MAAARRRRTHARGSPPTVAAGSTTGSCDRRVASTPHARVRGRSRQGRARHVGDPGIRRTGRCRSVDAARCLDRNARAGGLRAWLADSPPRWASAERLEGHAARQATMLILAVPFGLAIGLIVGAVGGGGAILALPVLVYVLNEPVSPASTSSLTVVALAAAVGAGSLARHGHVCWPLALTFSVPAAVGSLLGAVANNAVSGPALILAFVPVMLLAAGATWQRAGSDRSGEERPCPTVPGWEIVVAGFAVGTLTGFFGVGGGFVIVPVLTLWFGTTFRRAVATSLVIITLTAAAALISHVAERRPSRRPDHRRARRVHRDRRAARHARRPARTPARARPSVRGHRRWRGGVPAHRRPGTERPARQLAPGSGSHQLRAVVGDRIASSA